MLKTIWKFSLQTIDVQRIEIPSDYQILCVQVQDGEPYLWAMVDPDAESIRVTIETIGTGHRMDKAIRKYIGTYQMMNGRLVFHCFELNE